jgi:excisionase family DNA binding protein
MSTAHAAQAPETVEPVALAHTRKQACARLNIGLSLLDRLIDSKQLRAIKVGKRVLVPEAELQKLIAGRAAGSP